MDVEVKLFASFRLGRFKKQVISLPEAARLRDVIEQLGIAHDEIAMPLVNGQYSQLDQPLAANDTVSLFPAVAGG